MCFQGLTWTGEKMVLIEIAKILRRWRPLYEQDLGIMVDTAIQMLEDKANQPPRICWNGGIRSRWETSASQSSEQSYVAAIQFDVMAQAENCHSLVGVGVDDDFRPLGPV